METLLNDPDVLYFVSQKRISGISDSGKVAAAPRIILEPG